MEAPKIAVQELIEELLHSSEARDREHCALAFGHAAHVVQRHEALGEALSVLEHAARFDANVSVRGAALWAIGELGQRESEAFLMAFCESEKKQAWLLSQARKALWKVVSKDP